MESATHRDCRIGPIGTTHEMSITRLDERSSTYTRPMRLLAVADQEPHIPLARLVAHHQPDAVVLLGDLSPDWLDPLCRFSDLPIMGVYGNHDDGHYLEARNITDLHLRCVEVGDLRFTGFEGCVQYRHGAPLQYTQEEATRLARKLPEADVLLSHAPPRRRARGARRPRARGLRGAARVHRARPAAAGAPRPHAAFRARARVHRRDEGRARRGQRAWFQCLELLLDAGGDEPLLERQDVAHVVRVSAYGGMPRCLATAPGPAL